MTSAAHLTLIRARCVELLEIANGRTQGKWNIETIPSDGGGDYITGNITSPLHTYRGNSSSRGDVVCGGDTVTNRDAAFIAACAGNAESGWRSTIAAIDGLEDAYHALRNACNAPGYAGDAMKRINEILAAWPLEELQ